MPELVLTYTTDVVADWDEKTKTLELNQEGTCVEITGKDGVILLHRLCEKILKDWKD